ncbi:hypothetical protein CRG98_022448, partial [Punica granatum]
MGSGLSCFKPANRKAQQPDQSPNHQPDLIFAASEPLDETLGHSFCYVRSSARFLSPTPSDRFISPSQSLRFDDPIPRPHPRPAPETGFKAISGASVSANTATPRTVLQLDAPCDLASSDAALKPPGGCGLNGFESTSSFCALPLQPAPRGAGPGGDSGSGSGGFFLSGPIERGALSGPLDPSSGLDASGQVPFSAPIGSTYVKRKRRKKSISGIKKAIYGNFSEKKRPWVVPVLNFGAKKETPEEEEVAHVAGRNDVDNVQWALGKAGEDRVHVVVSEEQGWLFVGIYDGEEGTDLITVGENVAIVEETNPSTEKSVEEARIGVNQDNPNQGSGKRVTFQSEGVEVRRRRLWEYLAEEDPDDGVDLSGSQRFAFSVDDAIS